MALIPTATYKEAMARTQNIVSGCLQASIADDLVRRAGSSAIGACGPVVGLRERRMDPRKSQMASARATAAKTATLAAAPRASMASIVTARAVKPTNRSDASAADNRRPTRMVVAGRLTSVLSAI